MWKCSYLSVKDIAQTDLQLVADSSCRLAAVVHELDHTLILQNLLQAADKSCLDRVVICHHVENEADRSSIHLHSHLRVRVMTNHCTMGCLTIQGLVSVQHMRSKTGHLG